MAFSRNNALDQVLDIKGSFSYTPRATLSDEVSGLGAPTGQAGLAASITTFNAGAPTLTGLTGMTANSVGNFLTVSGAAAGGNNGTFMIITFVDATSVMISNSAGVAPEAGPLAWTERRPYCLNDDLDFERTDRTAIKGTLSFDGAIPTYQRPTAVGTLVPANLSNIAGKTTDAKGFIFSRRAPATAVATGNTLLTLTSAGTLRHSDSTNKTGVPCLDVVPYIGNTAACYVQITNPDDGTEFEVVTVGSPNFGNRVFGLTRKGAAVSPDSVEIELHSVAPGGDLSTAPSYTWEAAHGVATIDLVYGYFQQLDQVSEDAFRVMQSLGVEESATLRQDVTDLQAVVGVADSDTSLTLDNTGAFFAFSDLTDITPSVVHALNTLNEQIGDRVYITSLLLDGETITASLQKLGAKIDTLSGDVAASGVTRVIERLGADVLANTAHTLPAGATYVPDGLDNGLGLTVYTRGVLRDPGSVAAGNDYAEGAGSPTDTVTFYSALKAGDHINYYIFA